MKQRIVGSLSAAALALLPLGVAKGQSDDPYAPCSRIADEQERLACFDRTYAAQAALRADDAEEERAEFGFTDTQLSRRESEASDSGVPAAAEAGEALPADSTMDVGTVAADADDAADEVTSSVVEVFEDGARRAVILLANGQVWRATSNSNFRRRVRAGWNATIVRSLTGGYRLKFEGQRGFLGVSRVR